ncbi:MAG: adenylyltransferase/cytidyltransferase family protein [Candidatus Wildermuthbacteria bacterium]|nr:adenylyltransferase/cytidyltransferase family protein [Candidatus Wildermuthbacteria bacterium]
MKKRVAVFGIFDGVHKGHRSLFSQAKKKGDELFVIVGRDSTVLRLKKKKPRFSEKERLSMVLKEKLVDLAVFGDKELSTYKVIEKVKPNVICFGYDQKRLFRDCKKWIAANKKKISVFCLKPFHPEIYHSSRLVS